jgi:pyruvate/2-oxoglutarate dehydrogenase complex dihydrolipoamide dehydrogenase (E3) component
VRVWLGREADECELRACGADALVVASGSRWIRPHFTNGDGRVLDPVALLDGGEAPGDYAVVAGGGAVALGVAEWLAARGTSVALVVPEETVVEPLEQPGLLRRLAGSGLVRFYMAREVRRYENGSVTIGLTGAIGGLFEEELPAVSMLVAAGERRAEAGLAWVARERGLAGEVITVGDCEAPRSAYEAVLEGALAGRAV